MMIRSPINVEQVPTLFDEFSQADTSTTHRYGGTGLGLTITQQLCALMGGTVSVDTVASQGSTFTVRFPCVAGSRVPQE
jgi:signal transduction histidine kinase